MKKNFDRALLADVAEQLINHLRNRNDVQNIDLMNLSGFCRNCLSKWYVSAAEKKKIHAYMVKKGDNPKDAQNSLDKVYDFIKKITNNPVLKAIGNKPGSTKPYCHIDDLTQALILLAMNKKVNGEYNVVPDDQINIEQVAKAVMSGLEEYRVIEWL